MLDIRNVLCPVDRSDISRRALTVGAAMARWHDARLRVMEVVSAPLPIPAAAPVAVSGLSHEVRRNLLDELDRFAEPARAFGVPIHFDVEEGEIVSDILDEAARLPADLIVLGTHTSRSTGHGLGPVSEKILRLAKSPVLTVPAGPEMQPSGAAPFARIICAVDFSNASLKGLDFAIEFAREAAAALFVVHVIDWPQDSSLPESLAKAVAGTRQEWEDEKRRELEQIVAESVTEGVRVDTILVTGASAREILKAADDLEADLIIMGIHSRGPLDLAVFGSTTNHVVSEAPCPVLTVRAKG